MNSSTEHDFDEKLDLLLAESVGPGSIPPGLPVVCLPRRPRLNRMHIALGFSAVIPVAALFFIWLSRQLTDAVWIGALTDINIGMQLTDTIITATERLMSAEVLMVAAIIMAAVYIFFASRIVRLCKLC